MEVALTCRGSKLDCFHRSFAKKNHQPLTNHQNIYNKIGHIQFKTGWHEVGKEQVSSEEKNIYPSEPQAACSTSTFVEQSKSDCRAKDKQISHTGEKNNRIIPTAYAYTVQQWKCF